jgi:nucleotide-binding universal stress UspA family protein
MKLIVVGYDDSESAKGALERAAELATAFGSKMIVTSIARIVVGKGVGPVDPADSPELHREELRHAAAFLAERGLAGEYEVALGDPRARSWNSRNGGPPISSSSVRTSRVFSRGCLG